MEKYCQRYLFLSPAQSIDRLDQENDSLTIVHPFMDILKKGVISMKTMIILKIAALMVFVILFMIWRS